MKRAIEIENLGPITLLSHECPEGGGVVLLKAKNGKGKTYAINAVEAAVTGRGAKDLRPRDGTAKGSVQAFGAKLTVARQSRRDGTGLVVESLDGKFDLATLIDPGKVSKEAADKDRIKALITLAGVEPSVAIFRELFASDAEMSDIVSESATEADDLVVMAERIKRDIEAHARKLEGKANVEASHAKACRESAEGIDVNVETNSDKLQAAVEAAVKQQAAIIQRKEQAESHAKESRKISLKIEELKASHGHLSVETLTQKEAEALKSKTEADALVASLKEQLRQAEFDAKSADALHQRAVSELNSAREHEQSIKDWSDALVKLGDIVSAPTSEEIESAEKAITDARAAYNAGIRAQVAIEKIDKAKEHEAALKKITADAERLRESAAAVDDVLSDQIKGLGCALFVKNSRLMLNTNRGETLFDELSDGERSKVAIDISAEYLGENGLLTLSQSLWESLDPEAKRSVVDHAKERGVLILTAECCEDESIVVENL